MPKQGHSFWVEGSSSEFSAFSIRVAVCGVNDYLSWETPVAISWALEMQSI